MFIGLRCRRDGSRGGLAQNSAAERVDRLFRRRRERLAQSLAMVSALLGLSLVAVSLVKLFFGATSSVGRFSSAQAVQGILGAALVWVVLSGLAKFLSKYACAAIQSAQGVSVLAAGLALVSCLSLCCRTAG